MIERIVWVVLDSVGCGEMPDAAAYGDAGSDTLGNIDRIRPLRLPHFARLGLGNLKSLRSVAPADDPHANFGRCTLASPGKDTTTGHWEMAGIHLQQPFPLYPNGFPQDRLSVFEERIGRRSIGNCAASGTEIIQRLGDEHVRTGCPIVYTSADSVFQIAAHEQVIPLPELYEICHAAREVFSEVGRVIARPFVGDSGKYLRTANRKDYAVPPPRMLLDELEERSVPVHAIGKIHDVFLGRGITSYAKTKSNAEGVAQTITAVRERNRGLIFTNLVDFDMLFGHRNDVEGYAAALEQVDASVPELVDALGPADMLIFTADHGCDPTTPSTDHSREYVPLLVHGPSLKRGVDLGTRNTLADIGQTVAEVFEFQLGVGESFLSAVR